MYVTHTHTYTHTHTHTHTGGNLLVVLQFNKIDDKEEMCCAWLFVVEAVWIL